MSSEAEQFVAPDQRYFIVRQSYEMRMSHWIAHASLGEQGVPHPLLQLGDELWSAEQVQWHADSQCVSVTLRLYPGTVPPLPLDVYPAARLIQAHTTPPVAPFAFDKLDIFLANYCAHYD